MLFMLYLATQSKISPKSITFPFVKRDVIPLHESNPTAPHNLTVAQLHHLLPVSMADTLE